MLIDPGSEWNSLSDDFANFTQSSGESVGVYLIDAKAKQELGHAINKIIDALQGIRPTLLCAALKYSHSHSCPLVGTGLASHSSASSTPTAPPTKPTARRMSLADFTLVMQKMNASLVGIWLVRCIILF